MRRAGSDRPQQGRRHPPRGNSQPSFGIQAPGATDLKFVQCRFESDLGHPRLGRRKRNSRGPSASSMPAGSNNVARPARWRLSPARSTVSICWPLRQACRAGSSKANTRRCAGALLTGPCGINRNNRDEPVAVHHVECVVGVDRGVATGVQKFDTAQVKAGAPGGDRIIRVVTYQRDRLGFDVLVVLAQLRGVLSTKGSAHETQDGLAALQRRPRLSAGRRDLLLVGRPSRAAAAAPYAHRAEAIDRHQDRARRQWRPRRYATAHHAPTFVARFHVDRARGQHQRHADFHRSHDVRPRACIQE